MRALGAAAVGIFAGTQIIDFFKGTVAEAREAQKVSAQTAAVIKSTGGAAKVSTKDVDKLTSALSRKVGIDDEVIAGGANMLLTFTNVRNEVGDGNKIFNEATGIVTDMSVALGTDMKSSAIQVGKALNDPIKGVTALQRVGVTFTDEQKKTIARLVETGDTLGAQKVILQELTKEFGGSAAAQATAGDKMSVTWGNIKEQIGTALLPVLDRLANWFNEEAAPAISDFIGGLTGAKDATGDWADAGREAMHIAKDSWAILKDVGVFIKEHKDLVIGLGIAYGGLKTALKISSAVNTAKAALATLSSAFGAKTGAQAIAGGAAAGAAGGPAGLIAGIAAATGALIIWKTHLFGAGGGTDDLKGKISDLTGTLNEHTNAITQDTKAWIANQAAEDGTLETLKGAGLSLKGYVDAVAGGGQASQQFAQQVLKAYTSGKITQDQYESLIKTLEDNAVAVDRAKRQQQLENEALGQTPKLLKAAGQEFHQLGKVALADYVSDLGALPRHTTKALNGMAEAIQSGETPARAGMKRIAQILRNQVPPDLLTPDARLLVDRFTKGVRDKGQQDAPGAGSALVDFLLGPVRGGKGEARTAGKGLGTAITDGMSVGIRIGSATVESDSVWVVKNAAAAARQALDSHSPSKLFEGIFASVPQGAALGIRKGAPEVAGAMSSMVKVPTISLPRVPGFDGAALGGEGGAAAPIIHVYHAPPGEPVSDSVPRALREASFTRGSAW